MSLKPWQIEHSDYLINDRWLRVRSDVCRRSNGALLSPYYVLENPDWVSVFGLTASQDIVLINEYHHGAGVMGLGLPGGAIDGPDESPAVAAEREFVEETGYTPGQMSSLGSSFANWGNQTNRIHYFLAVDCQPNAAQDLDENEEIDVLLAALNDFSAEVLQQSFHLANAASTDSASR